MGSAAAAAAAFVRAMVTVPIEASSAARYIATSSATPTTRACVEAVGLRCLVLVRDQEAPRRNGDGEASRPSALPLFAADGGSGYLMELPLRRRGYELTTRPRALSVLLADDVSSPEVQIALRPRAYPLVFRPRAHFLKASRSVGEEDNVLGSSSENTVLTGTRSATRVLNIDGSLVGHGSASYHLLRPGGNPTFLRPKGMKTTLTTRRYYHSGLARSPQTNSQRMIELPSFQLSARRNWCWTPWSPNRPKAPKAIPTPPTSAQVVKQVINMLKDLKLTKEDEAILKEFFLEKFCTSKDDPQKNDVKMDLLLHGQAVANRMLHVLCADAEKKPKKWGCITILGKKIDLANWFATFISIFF